MSPPPDRFELTVRFVCGALLGVLVGLSAAFVAAEADLRPAAIVGSIVLAVLLCGGFAMRLGDRFWYGLRRWWC